MNRFVLAGLVLLAAPAHLATAQAQADRPGGRYTVQQNDTLANIAQRYYGDGSLWPIILRANPRTLGGDPNRLTPGMQLALPANTGAALGIDVSSGSSDDRLPYRQPQQSVEAMDNPELDLAEGPGAWIYNEGIARAIRREYLTFESAGRIAYVDPALKEGDRVARGDVIAYQDQRRPGASVQEAEAQIIQARTALAVEEATLGEARANLQLAEKTFERFDILLRRDSASKQEYDEALAQLQSARATVERAARQLDAARADIEVARANRATAEVVRNESRLVAPIDGVIARFNIEEGYYYSPSLVQTQNEQQLFDTVPVVLIDTSRYEISVNVPQNLLDVLAEGAPVLIDVIEPDATLEERLPDEEEGPPKPASEYRIRGEIYAISPVFDSDRRNFLVKIRTTQGHGRLRDGSTVALWINKIATDG